MKNILVTGGAGFIGSNFILHMLTKKNLDIYRIINLDALTYAGNLNNLKEVEEYSNYEFVQGDICDKTLVANLFAKYDIDTVVNFAAESHVDRSIENPEIFITTNVLGTHNLLEHAKKHWTLGGVGYKKGVKFLQVSTDEVYGALSQTGLFTEQTPMAPNSPYSASKASADMLVRAFNKTYSMPTSITRCSNNYGRFQYTEKLIPLMITKCMKGESLPVYGDGLQIRDWLHVNDHCTAIETVLLRGGAGEVYNIGGNNEMANIDIVKRIIEHLQKSMKLISYIEDRLGHDRRYAIDNTKITTQLGWKPKYTFEQGLLETVDWYVKNYKL